MMIDLGKDAPITTLPITTLPITTLAILYLRFF
jgi:hypothetical protein